MAFWKYLDFAILSTNLKIFLPVFPPPVLYERISQADSVSVILHLVSRFSIQRLKSKFDKMLVWNLNDINGHLECDGCTVYFLI